MQILTTPFLSPSLCRQHQDRIFVFGDNLCRKGTGGQAVIRYEQNSFGVATKRFPARVECAYFSDREDEIEAMVNDLRKLWTLAQTHSIVFPSAGLGTGLAKLPEKAPRTFTILKQILSEHFLFNMEGA